MTEEGLAIEAASREEVRHLFFRLGYQMPGKYFHGRLKVLLLFSSLSSLSLADLRH